MATKLHKNIHKEIKDLLVKEIMLSRVPAARIAKNAGIPVSTVRSLIDDPSRGVSTPVVLLILAALGIDYSEFFKKVKNVKFKVCIMCAERKHKSQFSKGRYINFCEKCVEKGTAKIETEIEQSKRARDVHTKKW